MSQRSFSGVIFLWSTVFLLNPRGRVGSTMDVSICEITVSVGFLKRAFSCSRSTRSTKFELPTSEKVVSFGFVTSGELEVTSG